MVLNLCMMMCTWGLHRAGNLKYEIAVSSAWFLIYKLRSSVHCKLKSQFVKVKFYTRHFKSKLQNLNSDYCNRDQTINFETCFHFEVTFPCNLRTWVICNRRKKQFYKLWTVLLKSELLQSMCNSVTLTLKCTLRASTYLFFRRRLGPSRQFGCCAG